MVRLRASPMRLLYAGGLFASLVGLCLCSGAQAQDPLMPLSGDMQDPAAPALTPPPSVDGSAASPAVAGQSGTQASVDAKAASAADTLKKRQDATRSELDQLSKSISLSKERATALEASILGLSKTNADLRQELIASAKRRKDIEKSLADGEKALNELRGKQDKLKLSLRERRSVLAEVLAALQRMGRNPPPALLVTPEDALSSVRSAILLGAVVPGMRRQTDQLAADLGELARLSAEATAQKDRLSADMVARLEEERRMDLLIARNTEASGKATSDLAAERAQAEALARKATSLEDLIASLESQLGSVKAAAENAAVEEAQRLAMTEEQRKAATERALAAVPDKNRIAPAFAFSDLKGKVELPVAGSVVRHFGDPDGTGHTAKGISVATQPNVVVTAPSDATVIFAGQFRSYGPMIILNAGDGYHMVLTGMEAIKTTEGQFVFAGQPIATMGAKRVASAASFALETDRPTLYIELRKDGKPVDSDPWWTALPTGKARNDT